VDAAVQGWPHFHTTKWLQVLVVRVRVRARVKLGATKHFHTTKCCRCSWLGFGFGLGLRFGVPNPNPNPNLKPYQVLMSESRERKQTGRPWRAADNRAYEQCVHPQVRTSVRGRVRARDEG